MTKLVVESLPTQGNQIAVQIRESLSKHRIINRKHGSSGGLKRRKSSIRKMMELCFVKKISRRFRL